MTDEIRADDTGEIYSATLRGSMMNGISVTGELRAWLNASTPFVLRTKKSSVDYKHVASR